MFSAAFGFFGRVLLEGWGLVYLVGGFGGLVSLGGSWVGGFVC